MKKLISIMSSLFLTMSVGISAFADIIMEPGPRYTPIPDPYPFPTPQTPDPKNVPPWWDASDYAPIIIAALALIFAAVMVFMISQRREKN